MFYKTQQTKSLCTNLTTVKLTGNCKTNNKSLLNRLRSSKQTAILKTNIKKETFGGFNYSKKRTRKCLQIIQTQD